MSKSNDGKPEQGQGPVLTTRQGHPVYDNNNNRAVDDRGPTVLENYLFLEKISHFDRERSIGRTGPLLGGYSGVGAGARRAG